MIRVTMELISARTGETELLGIAEICNDGNGSQSIGHYVAKLGKRGRPVLQDGRQIWRHGRVLNFPRLRLGAWDLLYRCLRSAVGDRNPEK